MFLIKGPHERRVQADFILDTTDRTHIHSFAPLERILERVTALRHEIPGPCVSQFFRRGKRRAGNIDIDAISIMMLVSDRPPSKIIAKTKGVENMKAMTRPTIIAGLSRFKRPQ